MKTSLHRFIICIALLIATSGQANVVAYVNHAFGIGNSLFANPLTASPNNTLSNLFYYTTVPYGTSVSLWNPASLSFATTSTYDMDIYGGWSANFTLNPGTGARLTTPSVFTNTFVGEVQNHDGSVFTGSLTNPPVYAGPNGIFLLGDKAPVAAFGDDIFYHILGRAPNVGEQVMTLTTTSTYLGAGTWDLIPSLGVSDAVFLNVGPVPEPSAAAISLLGLALLRAFRRKA